MSDILTPGLRVRVNRPGDPRHGEIMKIRGYLIQTDRYACARVDGGHSEFHRAHLEIVIPQIPTPEETAAAVKGES